MQQRPIVGQIDDVALVGLLIAELSQIGIEYVKKRQDNKATVDTSVNASVNQDNATTTVDVDAKA